MDGFNSQVAATVSPPKKGRPQNLKLVLMGPLCNPTNLQKRQLTGCYYRPSFYHFTHKYIVVRFASW